MSSLLSERISMKSVHSLIIWQILIFGQFAASTVLLSCGQRGVIQCLGYQTVIEIYHVFIFVNEININKILSLLIVIITQDYKVTNTYFVFFEGCRHEKYL